MSVSEICFGSFRFDTLTRVLWNGSAPVPLGARATAILQMLIENPGESISRDRLIERAWPGLHVGRGNLRVQISGIRRALGPTGNSIQADATLGYRFEGEVKRRALPSTFSANGLGDRPPSRGNAPIGREADIAGINKLFEAGSVVTILGPGGIGKTTVAVEVAATRSDAYRDGIYFVDLSRTDDPDALFANITSSVQHSMAERPGLDQIANALRTSELLLIFDCCEHVVQPVRQLVEILASKARGVDILITSREALDLQQEAIWRLGPLALPPSEASKIEDIEKFSSIKLFLECVLRRGAKLSFDEETAQVTSEICRRVDGVPLGIELAASMAAVLGVSQVHRSLGEQTAILNMDRRSIVPRQRSLFATIDWSYNLLSQWEQSALKRIAAFAGPFTLEAGAIVARGGELDVAKARDAILGLAQKSILSFDPTAELVQYRLLDTTRAYVSQVEVLPVDQLAFEQHALYVLDLLERTDWDMFHRAADRATRRSYFDEVRVALDWSLANQPDIGIKLALAAERMWLELGSLVYGVAHLTAALQHSDNDRTVGPEIRSRLLVSLASAQIYIPGVQREDLYERAWHAARTAGNADLELRALYGIIQGRLLTRRSARQHLDSFEQVARSATNRYMQYIYQRISAFAAFEESDLIVARKQFEAFLDDKPVIPRSVFLHFGGIDSVISCEIGLALTKYYQGYCDEARQMLGTAVEAADRYNHATTSYYVLAQGATWASICSQEFDTAARYLQKLTVLAKQYPPWQALVDAFRSLILRYANDRVDFAEKLLTRCLQDPYIRKTGSLYPILWVELADMRRVLSDWPGAEAALSAAMSECLGDNDVRLLGKHHPVRARMLVARNRGEDLPEARMLLESAIYLSRSREFWLYEADACVGLAELEIAVGRVDEARQILGALLTRFGDRRSTPYLVRAHQLLDQAHVVVTDHSGTAR